MLCVCAAVALRRQTQLTLHFVLCWLDCGEFLCSLSSRFPPGVAHGFVFVLASLAHGFVAHGFVFSSWCWPHACSSSRRIHASMHTATMLSSVSLQHVAMFILQMRRTPTQITILTVFGCSPDRLALPVTPLHAHSHLASVENCSLHAHVTPRTQSFGECGRLLR
jgi:hypothetical protein